MKNIPLTSTQMSIYLSQMVNSDSALFNLGGYALIEGEIDLIVFKDAFTRLIHFHPALSLQLRIENDEVFQYVSDNVPQIGYYDFSDKSDDFVLDWINKEFNVSFKIIDNKLWDCVLIKKENNKYYWFLKIHHVLVDGYSIGIIFNHLNTLYSKSTSNNLISDKTALSFIDYVQEEIKYKNSPAYNNDRLFWIEKIKNLPSKLLLGMDNLKKMNLEGARFEILIDRVDFSNIEKFCKNNRVTIFHYLISVFCVFITNTFFVNDFIIGLPVHNRISSGIKESVGPYFNVLPYRYSYDNNLTILQLINNVKSDLLKTLRHSRFPILDTIKAVKSSGNLFNISLSYQKFTYEEIFAEKKSQIQFIKGKDQLDDLSVHLLDFNSHWDLKLVFDCNKYFIDKDNVDLILKNLKHLLLNFHRFSDKKIFEIDVMSGETLENFGNIII